jgi:hypothetical protein
VLLPKLKIKIIKSNQNTHLTKEKGRFEYMLPLLLGHETNIILPQVLFGKLVRWF